MKMIFWVLLIAVSICHSKAADDADEYAATMFDVSWIAVNRMALGEVGASWSDLMEADPKAANFLALFWFTKCHMEHHAYWSSVKERLLKTFAHEKDLNVLAAARTREESQMLQCFLYDHARDVRAMVEMRLQSAKAGTSPTLDSTRRLEELRRLRDAYFHRPESKNPRDEEPELPRK